RGWQRSRDLRAEIALARRAAPSPAWKHKLMNKLANTKRVLALDVRARSFGYVVFEGPALLLDWGVQSFRNGRNAVRVPLATKIAALLEDFQPAVVVAKEPPSRKKVNRARTRKVLEVVPTRPAC